MKKLEKVIIILLFILVILLFLNNTLNDFLKERSIEAKIGKKALVSEVSLAEYISLSETTVGAYLKKLRNANYEGAYKMLSPEYKNIVSEEEFKNNMKNIDMSAYHLESIIHRTENMYVATVVTADNVSHQILIIINDESFSIVPEPFLDFVQVERKITKDKVEYELIGYAINLDSCIFEVNIKNNSKNDVNIGTARIKNDIGTLIDTNEVNEIIPAKSEKKCIIEFETNLDFPTYFEIDRNEEKRIRTYSFEL